MTVFLHGLKLQSYRGIRAAQTMGPFQKFNFFIGANNAGKSTVLNFLQRHLPQSGGKKKSPEGFEIPVGQTTAQMKMGIGLPPQLFLDRIMQSSERFNNNSSLREHLKSVWD